MTDLARWEDVARTPSPWRGRLKLLAARIPPGVSVLDLGAGSQELRELLPAGCTYQAVDIVAGPGVTVLDLDVDPIPPADVIVMAGLLEYLRSAALTLCAACNVARVSVLFSYATIDDEPDFSKREAAGWRSHMDIETIAHIAGARRFATWEGQGLYVALPLAVSA